MQDLIPLQLLWVFLEGDQRLPSADNHLVNCLVTAQWAPRPAHLFTTHLSITDKSSRGHQLLQMLLSNQASPLPFVRLHHGISLLPSHLMDVCGHLSSPLADQMFRFP